LLAGAEAPAERWHELAFDAGEHLLHAAGRAHERLTGERLPASNRAPSAEPRGVEWEERDLPHIFGDLAAALPDSWFQTDDGAPSPDVEVRVRTERGITALLGGDHAAARGAVEALVADPSRWELVAADQRVDVAY